VAAGKQTLLFDPKVQLLANTLLTGSLIELLPSPDNELGIRYLEAERITSDEPIVVKKWLENLASNGILEGRLVRKLVLCPNCNSSDNQRSFDRPQASHVCEKCGRSFAIEDATQTELYAYRLSKDAESQFGGESPLLKPFAEVLAGFGYNVTIGGVLHGASGTDHRFNLVGARETSSGKEEETIVVDVVASDRSLNENPVAVMFAKRYDTDADKSALIAIPGIVENGRKLASLYKIVLIEAGSTTEAVDKLRSGLSP
jgi:hypothetical protein